MAILKGNGNVVDWHNDHSTGDLIRTETTTITDDFMREIEIIRELQAAKGRIGEVMHVMRVPGAIFRRWQAEGFDPTTATEDDYDALLQRLREMKARLQRDGFDKFILTNKTF